MKPGHTDITGRAGLTLVVEAARAFGLTELAAECLDLRKRDRGYSDAEKLEALVTLIAAGGDCVEDVRILGSDTGLQASVLAESELPAETKPRVPVGGSNLGVQSSVPSSWRRKL